MAFLSKHLSIAIAVVSSLGASAGCRAPGDESVEPVRESWPLAMDQARLYVAHAGGSIEGWTYTNSLEALDKALADGCRYLEVDFDWTRDGRLALIHDWQSAAGRTFGEQYAGSAMTSEQFVSTPRLDGLTSMTGSSLVEWLASRPEAFLVTDIKSRNVDGLRRLAELADEPLRARIVPQIYFFEELGPVLEMGFERVILTLYQADYDDEQVAGWSRLGELWAVTMPLERANGGLAQRLDSMAVRTFVHTINRPRRVRRLVTRLGVDGIYTDHLCARPDLLQQDLHSEGAEQ